MVFLFFAHLINALLMIAMPIGLAVWLTRTWKLGWRLWFIGAATFILSQVGHIPFLQLATQLMNRPPLVNVFLNMSPTGLMVFNGVFLGLAAGLFEELFRYAMFRWWAKDARSWRKGVLAGAGHGGAEAIIFGGLALFSFIQLVGQRNGGLSSGSQAAAYWSSSWVIAFLPAYERLCTIIIQVSMAVLVLQTFTRRQWFWVWFAVLYHALIDFITVPASAGVISIYVAEAIIGGFALFSLFIIFALRRPEPVEQAQPDAPSAPSEPAALKSP
jgi:uncharacterized membrane protein YhfC